MDFSVQALDFAGQLGDRLQQAFIDVTLRNLLARVTNEIFGGGNGHGPACGLSNGNLIRRYEFSCKISFKSLATGMSDRASGALGRYSSNCRDVLNAHAAILWQMVRNRARGPRPMAVLLSERLAERPKKTYPRGEVICRKCASPIYVYKLNTLPDEFSVRCPRCGDRGIHLKRAVTIQELPERRKKPRR
jgi:hypothetical protein